VSARPRKLDGEATNFGRPESSKWVTDFGRFPTPRRYGERRNGGWLEGKSHLMPAYTLDEVERIVL